MIPVAPLLEAALAYANRGWAVFPLKRREKVPITEHGLLDAVRDAALIGDWWDRWPDANVGVRTGAESNLLVVDVDGADGHDALAERERAYGSLPLTISTVTGRGGHHYLFQHPGREVRNSAGQLGPGLDVRGDGGYIVAPPSMHPSGRRYAWDNAPGETPLARAPGWLLELACDPRSRHPRVGQGAASEVGSNGCGAPMAPGRPRELVQTWLRIAAGVGEGERNASLTRLVGHLLARGVDARLVRELAQLVDGRNRPPLGAGEVDRIVESIAGRQLRQLKSRRRR